VFYDDNSSDATLDLLGRHPRVEVRRFERTDPSSFVRSTQDLQNHIWKESKGSADWVIITVPDEHLYHPDFVNYLHQAKRKGVTAIPGLGYEMLAKKFPAHDTHLATAIRHGMVWENYSVAVRSQFNRGNEFWAGTTQVATYRDSWLSAPRRVAYSPLQMAWLRLRVPTVEIAAPRSWCSRSQAKLGLWGTIGLRPRFAGE